MNNPIIEEIREARAALAAEHDYDFDKLNEWARKATEQRRLQQLQKAAAQMPAVETIPAPQIKAAS